MSWRRCPCFEGCDAGFEGGDPVAVGEGLLGERVEPVVDVASDAAQAFEHSLVGALWSHGLPPRRRSAFRARFLTFW
ncbi:MAG TPA: hypothetical protein VM656_09125 [Pyrinomonadaceae bacterium]|nr:hypothetical protein [Pyrinomonadaceae bacterium]